MLAKVEAFAGLGPEARAALQAGAELLTVRGGELLVGHGEVADTLYIVSTGRFHVILPGGKVVAEIEAGEPIGELAFFAGGTRTADVRAARDSTVFALSRAVWQQVTDNHRQVSDAILAEIARRLARTTSQSAAMAARPGRVVALLSAGASRIPDGLAERLAAALAAYESVRLVGQQDAPAGLAPESEDFGRWIAELEASDARILLTGNEDENWNRAIARNADDLLLTAPLGDNDTALSALEIDALPRFLPDDRTLVLWRTQDGAPITGTGRWLALREVKLHHHIALDAPASIARLARFIAGTANGVVLAGGGALGCAHLGVMQALIEEGVPIDFYGGTSAGAAMAGALALGLSAEETLAQMEEMFITRRAMRRVTIPVHSFLDPRVFDAQLQMRYGTGDIADLPVNYFAVSTNLSTGRIHVHRRGPLWEAVRASGSLPTILPPFVTSEGEVLIDGGVLDNVPVEIMARSMVVGSQAGAENALAKADVLLIPPIPEGMQILDWHKGRAVAEAARTHTLAAIAERPELAAMKAR